MLMVIFILVFCWIMVKASLSKSRQGKQGRSKASLRQGKSKQVGGTQARHPSMVGANSAKPRARARGVSWVDKPVT